MSGLPEPKPAKAAEIRGLLAYIALVARRTAPSDEPRWRRVARLRSAIRTLKAEVERESPAAVTEALDANVPVSDLAAQWRLSEGRIYQIARTMRAGARADRPAAPAPSETD
ncbi:hypothetical protein [Amycolatopsis anabasis]|uniref:hypothetical protein n=1 Tax=Amycolatopsis anabasis TaxID=1840409 RepID=UPI00131E5759|nr:hypothetical protein [Amycolatopsis anabasis]